MSSYFPGIRTAVVGQRNAEAAIPLEMLGKQLATVCDVDILCGYSLASFQGGICSYIFRTNLCGACICPHLLRSIDSLVRRERSGMATSYSRMAHAAP